jgi:sugar lactone lactonase YvrE
LGGQFYRMKIKTLPYLLICLLTVGLLSAGCNKTTNSTAYVPVIANYPVVSDVGSTTAKAYAYVTDNGAGTLSAVGFCWSATNPTPTINDLKNSRAVDTTNFALSLTGLTPNTTYYVRAYVTNEAGTGYSNVLTFKTNTTTYALTATVSTLMGTGAPGYIDGATSVAQLSYPIGICADTQGNIYVADFYNNLIRKITPAGVSSTFAGNGALGYVDGAAAVAQFNGPQGIAIDASGTLYVTDSGNSMIRKISPAGVVSTLAGRGYAGYADGTGTAAAFNFPAGLAVDASGNIYVADRGNNMIRMITPTGVVSTLAGNTTAGQVDATGTAAAFYSPAGVAYDTKANTLYVTDLGNYALRSITSAGVVSTVIGSAAISSALGTPWGLAIDAAENLYITDSTGRILELSASGVLTNLAGTQGTAGFTNGTNAAALFNNPRGICVNTAGAIYVSEYSNHAIRKIVLTTTP